MIYVLTDSNPPATAKLYKITPMKCGNDAVEP
jgi:hypothetical protein